MSGFVSCDAYDCTASHLRGGVVFESKLAPVDSINQIIRENRVGNFSSSNLALGMWPSSVAVTARSIWVISKA